MASYIDKRDILATGKMARGASLSSNQPGPILPRQQSRFSFSVAEPWGKKEYSKIDQDAKQQLQYAVGEFIALNIETGRSESADVPEVNFNEVTIFLLIFSIAH